MKRKLLLLAALAVCAASLTAFRPYNQRGKAKTAWMTVSALTTGQEYYLEVSQDGQALMRVETPKSLLTRRGAIKPQLVKDFFREIENSEIINSQNVKQSKMVFYRGDMLKVSAYISGELTRTEAPLNNFGEAFSYAFTQVKKAVAALPQEKKLRGFLRAEPVEGEALEAFTQKAAVDGEVKNIETKDVNRLRPLMAAIKEPHRLVPIETEAEAKELQDFVTARQLQGLRTLFYIPTTRGTFKCEIVEAARAKPAQKPAPAKAAAPRK
ncbi:MAG: hypothetical protein A2X35_07285 [Elusimicrobia bacterium GWA2_61_42]|nr:MAG: hypothetical protein A2X35_07285 [Elusimicrobia bacterium GWA2_61_42]OGR75015.1 MAG: hypothetical protein A2X38_01435 [Elusimicrobia bacterium GWC2_61_25]